MARFNAGSIRKYIKDDLEFLNKLGPRPCGSENLLTAKQYFCKKLEEIKPRKIEFQEFPVERFKRETCSISINSPVKKSLDSLSFAFCENVKAENMEIVYVGKGLAEDFKQKAEIIKNRVALVNVTIGYHRSAVIKQAQKYKAAGLIMISNLPDGYPQTGYTSQRKEFDKIFGAGISTSDGILLIELINEGNIPLLDIHINNSYSPSIGKNIAASFCDSSSSHFLLTAHLDSWDVSSGISDNGSGVAIVMAIAKILSQTDIPFKVVLFDGEEQGLKGSNHYVKNNCLDNIIAVINFDIVGMPYKLVMTCDIEGINNNKITIPQSDISVDIIKSDIKQLKYSSDHLPFARKSIPIILPVSKLEFGRGLYYHTAYDTLDNFNAESLVYWPQVITNLLKNE